MQYLKSFCYIAKHWLFAGNLEFLSCKHFIIHINTNDVAPYLHRRMVDLYLVAFGSIRLFANTYMYYRYWSNVSLHLHVH